MSYVLPFVLACLACSVPWSPCSVGRGAFFWQYPTVSAIKDEKRHKKRSKNHKNRETLRTCEKSAKNEKRTCQKRVVVVCGVFSLIGVVGVGGVGVVSPLVIEALDSNQTDRDNQKTPLSSSTKGKHTKIVLFLSSCRHLNRFRLTFAVLPLSLWGNWEGW
jgi:hypothetical protein